VNAARSILVDIAPPTLDAADPPQLTPPRR